MSNIYTDPWGYDGDVSFIKRNPCGCQDERSDEQIKIDDKQDADKADNGNKNAHSLN